MNPIFTVSDEEYVVITKWYDEWVKSCRLLATFAFSATGFIILAFIRIEGPIEHSSEFVTWITIGLFSLVTSGMLAFLSVAFAYAWLDAVHRRYMPSLMGKVLYTKGWIPSLKLGRVGWLVTVLSLILILIGIGSIVYAASALL